MTPSRRAPWSYISIPQPSPVDATCRRTRLRKNHDKFAAVGASVVGVSLDNIARLNQFSADPQYCAGKLPVASDATGAIAKSFGVNVTDTYKGQPIAQMKNTRGDEIGHSTAERTTFVVAPDGKIVATIGGLGGDANAEQALAVVQQMAASHSH